IRFPFIGFYEYALFFFNGFPKLIFCTTWVKGKSLLSSTPPMSHAANCTITANMTKVAAEMSISRTTLYRKMNKYQIKY
ncbi:MAG: helix-turn-helix domain-containing protein, partial [Clostridiales bacterium]